ncbi:four helix bundle protein [Ekhidna lutea]|uniref:Four helix bundle protein n=1 Tax=Ekhidna lutea TaxID=447679 RepID=A0A239HM48_EKHLU|nr:four helix bundle protein [Ekhidna lutea]SNS82417.1 four helix bundle protein [Ekhidna lutea]
MSEKVYDLEERTFQFTKSIRMLSKKLPKTPANIEDVKQVIRSSGSIGANYIEANEALSKKDFLFRVKISRKEAKESAYWLRLILETNDQEFSSEIKTHFDEATELKKILSAIISKSG